MSSDALYTSLVSVLITGSPYIHQIDFRKCLPLVSFIFVRFRQKTFNVKIVNTASRHNGTVVSIELAHKSKKGD